MSRRDGQKIDPLSNELFIKTVYAPMKLKVKEKETTDEEDEEDDDNDDNDEERDETDSKQDDELDDDLVIFYGPLIFSVPACSWCVLSLFAHMFLAGLVVVWGPGQYGVMG